MILSGLLVRMQNRTSGRLRIIDHISGRHPSASSMNVSEVMLTLSMVPAGTLYIPLRSFLRGMSNCLVLATADAFSGTPLRPSVKNT